MIDDIEQWRLKTFMFISWSTSKLSLSMKNRIFMRHSSVKVLQTISVQLSTCDIIKFTSGESPCFPETFDYIGSSHQLWHVLILGAFLWWTHSLHFLVSLRLGTDSCETSWYHKVMESTWQLETYFCGGVISCTVVHFLVSSHFGKQLLSSPMSACLIQVLLKGQTKKNYCFLDLLAPFSRGTPFT